MMSKKCNFFHKMVSNKFVFNNNILRTKIQTVENEPLLYK